MDKAQLATVIDQYAAGLEAEIVILRRIEGAAARQREASAAGDLTAFHHFTDERDSLMASLVNVESQVKELRRTLSECRKEVQILQRYRDAVELHQQAMALVEQILKTDGESTEALAQAELVRRDTARALEQGETTLSAYRRVMTAKGGGALVDRRG
jgi:hypothetical protein